MEELSALKEDELLDGVWIAELLGFSESEYSEDIEGDEWKAKGFERRDWEIDGEREESWKRVMNEQ